MQADLCLVNLPCTLTKVKSKLVRDSRPRFCGKILRTNFPAASRGLASEEFCQGLGSAGAEHLSTRCQCRAATVSGGWAVSKADKMQGQIDSTSFWFYWRV